MPGELRDDRVVVREQAEANRLYNKGWFGRPRSGGSLDLDLVEAAFLLDAGRLKIGDDGAWDAQRFLTEAATLQDDFEVRFQVYRELRERGLAPQVGRDAGNDFLLPARDATSPRAITMRVRPVNERSPARVADLFAFARTCEAAKISGLVAVVDEESEVTTYEVGIDDPRGEVASSAKIVADATLLVDRVVVWDAVVARRLHESEFFGKLVGLRLLVSLVEALHLARQRGLRVKEAGADRVLSEAQLGKAAKKIEPGIELRRRVYDDLKARRLVPKTGYKFGTHFRAYETDPTGTHAPFLVQCVASEDAFEWPQLARAVRLAHGVRKTLLLGLAAKDAVSYLRLVRAK